MEKQTANLTSNCRFNQQELQSICDKHNSKAMRGEELKMLREEAFRAPTEPEQEEKEMIENIALMKPRKPLALPSP